MRTARDGSWTRGPIRASARSGRRPVFAPAATGRRGRRPLPPRTSRFRGATSKRPSLTRRDAPRPFGSSDSRETAVLGPVRTSDRRRCRVSVASASRNRTCRGVSRSPSTRLAAAVASADDTTGRTVTIRSWTLVGRVCNDRRRAFRSTPVPGRASTTRIDSVRDIDPGVAPRVAEPVVEPVGELRHGDRAEAIGELHLPAFAGAPRGRALGRATPRRPPRRLRPRGAACARSSRPLVAASAPPGPTRRMGRSRRAAAARATATRASLSVDPPTSTPAIVVPRGSVSRSRRAIAPNATARTATRHGDEGEDDQRLPRATAGPPDGREERA